MRFYKMHVSKLAFKSFKMSAKQVFYGLFMGEQNHKAGYRKVTGPLWSILNMNIFANYGKFAKIIKYPVVKMSYLFITNRAWKNLSFFLAVGLLSLSTSGRAQSNSGSDSIPILTLDQCIDYAMQHQPTLKQS